MPTNTDLVTDLPADFEVFGQAVATSMADLLGGTSGQILAKNSNTDMDFVWIANDQGDITGITATSPLTGGGTSGAITVGIQSASTSQAGAVQLSDSTSTTSSVLAATPTAVKSSYDLAAAAIPKSTVTTTGDVIYATGSSAVTRLGIGTAGQVLTVNGGATAPSWATPASGGGMTLLQTVTLTGASVTTSSIAGTYKELRLYVRNFKPSSGDNGFNVRVNTDTATNYITVAGFTTTANQAPNATSWRFSAGQNDTASSISQIDIIIPDYANTVTGKMSYGYGMTNNYTTSTNYNMRGWMNWYNQTAAITSLTFLAESGNLGSGSVLVYGVS